MKRFISLVTVFMLAFALAVPVGASSPMVQYGDDFYPLIPANSNPAEYPYSVIIERPYASSSDYYLWFAKSFTTDGSEHTVGDRIEYILDSDTNMWVYDGDDPANRPSAQYYVVRWTNKDILRTGGTNVFYSASEPIYSVCDGSFCPATDVNIDGFCDDCGMMLMSLSRSPVAPDVTGNNKNYVMFYSGTVYQYTAYTSDSSYTIRGEEYGARYRTYLEPAVTATRFQSYDGINWEHTYNGKTSNDYPGEIGWELISSTYDWYTEEGDRFFPVPLWEEVEKVTQGEMSNLTTETAGTMTTLVVCGVGLMACLMALSLFGKRWLLFLR